MSTTSKLILILSYAIIALAFLFYCYFPTLFSPLSTDIISVSLIFTLFSVLIYGSIKAKTQMEIILFLSTIAICGILARCIPQLRFAYPPLQDPYQYATSTINISEFGTLRPILINWYSLVQRGLYWPMLSLNTVTLSQITNINLTWFFQYQEPILGVAFTLGVFLLANEITQNNKIALISTMIATIGDVIVSYQSEYHPQGLAFIFFVFFLWSYIKSINNSRIAYKCLAILFLIGFLLSHHFSAIFVAILALALVMFSIIVFVFPRNKSFEIIKSVRVIIQKDFIFLALIALTGFAYQLFVYDGVFRALLIRLTELQFPSIALTPVINAPFLTLFLKYGKWGILLLALFTIIRILRSTSENELRLLVLLLSTLAAGLIGSFVAGAPIDRFIGFYIPLISIFAAMTIYTFFTSDRIAALFKFTPAKIGIVLLAGILISMNFFNVSVPAFVFKSISVNPYYWYSNNLSSIDYFGPTGQWIKVYTTENAKYVGDWGDYLIPFYFAERPDQNVAMIENSQKYPGRYIVVSPQIPSCQYEGQLDKEKFLETIDTLYANDSIVVGKIPP